MNQRQDVTKVASALACHVPDCQGEVQYETQSNVLTNQRQDAGKVFDNNFKSGAASEPGATNAPDAPAVDSASGIWAEIGPPNTKNALKLLCPSEVVVPFLNQNMSS